MTARQYFPRLVLLTMLALPLAGQAGPRYSVTVLAGAGSAATDVNNSGQAVGWLSLGDGTHHAFVNSAGTLTDLGTLGGANSSAARINDGGQIVGSADTADASRAFLYSGGKMTDLGTLGGTFSSGAGINKAGVAVGTSAFTGSEGLSTRAFTDSDGAMHNIGTFSNGDRSAASGINNDGHVVGASAIGPVEPGEHPYHAFLYKRGVMTDLGTFGGLFSSAAAVNDYDQVVGVAGLPPDPVSGNIHIEHAFLYSAGVMHDLGTLTGGQYSFATDINKLGQVVGGSESASGPHGFLYDGFGLLDLNALIDPASGWTVRDANGINDMQQIAATACKDGQCYAVRLDLVSAVPEPAGFGMLLAGTVLIGYLRRRARPATAGRPAGTSS